MTQIHHMVIFGLFFTAVISIVHYYLWRRLVKDINLSSPLRRLFTGVLIFFAISAPATMIFSHTMTAAAAKTISFVPLLWLGTMMFLVVLLASIDLFRFIFFLRRQFFRHIAKPPIDENRRIALKKISTATTLGISGALTITSVLNVKRDASVIRRSVQLSKFPKALNGFTIAQLSDIHIGLTLDGNWLRKIVHQVNTLNPDIIVITGDLVDGYVHQLGQELQPLKKLQATHGIFFVTGNHEYYFDAPKWILFLEQMGIAVLQNSGVQIGDNQDTFLLAGVTDFQAARLHPSMGPNIKHALSERRTNQETVLLCHQPRIIHQAADNDVGLILSGHTHGGQIWPFTYAVRLQQPYNKGLIQHNDRTTIYINQGTGYWGPPMRLGTECEITLLTLHRKEKIND